MRRLLKNDPERFFLKADRLPLELPAWEYHVHTQHTDGEMSVAEAVDRALAIGLTRLVFTEHTEPWRAESTDWFSRYVAEIHRERERVGERLEILIGLEVPATDLRYGLEMTSEMEQEVEFVLGTAHRYPGLKGRVSDLPWSRAIDLEFRTLISLAHNPRVDAIAHIGATCQMHCGPFPMDFVEEIIKEATEQGVAIDLNARYHERVADYLGLCRKYGAWIIPGSDAHRPEEIGRGIERLKFASYG